MGKTAVVTGGASGIGLAVCRHLADGGHRVAVLDIDEDGAETAADSLRRAGAEAMAVPGDVADRGRIDEALGRVRSAFGPVEILVTCAGISPFTALSDITLDAWNRVLAVNLTGTFQCIQAVIGDMVAGGWGRIVTIASAAGQVGSPRMAHYAASKGGVISLTKAVAREYGRSGITVNTIPPYLVDTPMSRKAMADGDLPSVETIIPSIPVGRPGTADDIAATCAFLCSEVASYITGQVIPVNGGAIV